MPGAAWLSASATMSKTDGSALDISSAVCRLDSKAILWVMSDWTASRSACSCSTRSACRVMNAIEGACDGHADDDGPQELVPGAAGGRVGLVGRCGEAVADGVLQGGERCIEAGLGRLLHLGQVRGLRRLRPAGQEGAEAVLRGDEGGHAGGQVRSQVGVARCGEEVLEVA